MLNRRFENKKRRLLTAARMIVLGFGLIIFVGAGLLCLPFAVKGDAPIPFINALFTATSATCVTGLTVVDVFTTFTVFGQIVILLLIQVGGIGFMATTSFIYLAFTKHVKMSTRLTLNEDISDGNIRQVKKFVYRILFLTFVTEALGAAVLIGDFSRYMAAGDAVWNGVFTSISAFCNAGLDIINLPGSSLTDFSSDPLALVTIAFLIIIGGLGFIVVSDIWDAKRWSRYKLHTKIVLGTTLCLILGGTFFFFGVEFHNPETLGTMSGGDKFLNAFFQAVTARTAGFNSIEISNMMPASRFCLDFLMFIGASPGSTGGGIKTTTLFILIITIFSVIRHRKYAIVDKQKIGQITVHKASAVFMLTTLFMVLATLILLITDGASFTFEQLLFEQISAYATVGLSLGITAGLSMGGKLVIMICMFMGRIGMLTFFMSFVGGKISPDNIQYPECVINF